MSSQARVVVGERVTHGTNPDTWIWHLPVGSMHDEWVDIACGGGISFPRPADKRPLTDVCPECVARSWEDVAAFMEQQNREAEDARRAYRPEVVHIRKRAAKYGQMSGPRYSNLMRAIERGEVHDPQSDTLCGDPATSDDMSWAETQWAKNRTYVTCTTCTTIRIDQGVRS